MTFPETQTTRSSRRRTGFIALVFGGFFIVGGVVFSQTPTNLLFGIGLGLLAIFGAVHALASKPVLSLDDAGIRIGGWLLPSSNMDLKWTDLAGASLATLVMKNSVRKRVLWLTDKKGRLRIIEEPNFENFPQIVDYLQEKLAGTGLNLEIV